jgi:hypothetical protein
MGGQISKECAGIAIKGRFRIDKGEWEARRDGSVSGCCEHILRDRCGTGF